MRSFFCLECAKFDESSDITWKRGLPLTQKMSMNERARLHWAMTGTGIFTGWQPGIPFFCCLTILPSKLRAAGSGPQRLRARFESSLAAGQFLTLLLCKMSSQRCSEGSPIKRCSLGAFSAPSIKGLVQRRALRALGLKAAPLQSRGNEERSGAPFLALRVICTLTTAICSQKIFK